MSFRILKDVYYLKNFDAYSKPLEDFRIKTLTGAIMSIISGAIIILLAISEFRNYLKPEITQELLVDVTRGEKLPIFIDILFPHIGCDFISLDAMDVSGDQQLDVDHEIYKIKLDESLTPISPSIKHNVTKKMENNTATTEVKNVKCGTCYGAETELLKCCNSCDDVRTAYRNKGWALTDLSNIRQCKEEGWDNKLLNFDKEGCRMHGMLKVNKVAGNFHFSPGRSYTQAHVHVHDINSFGKTNYPGLKNPLDNITVRIDQMSHMYTYYIKVVPTTYIKLNGSKLYTNQYSVTKHIKPTALSGGHDGLPGVFFNYDIAPIMVWIKEDQKSIIQFVTNLCAIIGGVFTVFSLMDSIIYHSSKVVREKMEVGKLS